MTATPSKQPARRAGLASRARREKPTAGEVRAELTRVLDSDTFRRSSRLLRFLRFTVERVLAGKRTELKEYMIATEVYDRKSSFDPRLDPIIRVEARRLRAKLGEYYAGEGENDPVVIDYPLGEYAPQFRRRPLATPMIGPSVAVLPFVDQSPRRDQEFACDGIAEEITATLAKLGRIRVVPWSVSSLRSARAPVRDLSQRLGVAAVVRGSLRTSGQGLRVTAELIDSGDGACLWSHTYARDVNDLHAVQESIARAVADALHPLPAASPHRVLNERSSDPAAYQLFLRGRYLLNRQSDAGYRDSVKYLEQAVAKDPSFAMAHATLAQSLLSLAFFGGAPPREVAPRAALALGRALDLDPHCVAAQTAQALHHSIFAWRWDDAERAFQRALALDPNYATAHHLYAVTYLVPMGRLEQATTQLERALALDPVSLTVNFSLATVYYMRGEFELAREHALGTIELDPISSPAYFFLAMVYIQTGRLAQAVETLEEIRGRGGATPFVIGALAQSLALIGQHDRARRLLRDLQRMARTRYVDPLEIARVFLGFRDPDGAFEWLEHAYEARSGRLIWLAVHPLYDPLRADPRCGRLLARLGLTPLR